MNVLRKILVDYLKTTAYVPSNKSIAGVFLQSITFDNIKIHLSSIGTIYNYFLFDTSGKLIKEGNFKDNESIISLENFPTATYFLKVISENGFEKNIKIIKNEK